MWVWRGCACGCACGRRRRRGVDACASWSWGPPKAYRHNKVRVRFSRSSEGVVVCELEPGPSDIATTKARAQPSTQGTHVHTRSTPPEPCVANTVCGVHAVRGRLRRRQRGTSVPKHGRNGVNHTRNGETHGNDRGAARANHENDERPRDHGCRSGYTRPRSATMRAVPATHLDCEANSGEGVVGGGGGGATHAVLQRYAAQLRWRHAGPSQARSAASLTIGSSARRTSPFIRPMLAFPWALHVAQCRAST